MNKGPLQYLIIRCGDGRFRWFKTDGDGRITSRSHKSFATLEECLGSVTDDIEGEKSGEKIPIYFLDKIAVWPLF